MLCVFEKQVWPTEGEGYKKKPIESENGRYIIQYLCLDNSDKDPLAVDKDGTNLFGKKFSAKGYKIPRDKLARYDIKGHWEENGNFRTFIIEDYEEVIGKDETSVISYLKNRLPNVGPVIAKKMWDKFGPDIFDVLEKTPKRLGEIKGLGNEEKQNEIITAYNERKSIRNIEMLFISLGLNRNIADVVYNECGLNSEKIVTQNPFSLVRRIRGISFEVADKIAIKNQLKKDSYERIRAAILEVLYQAEMGGEFFLEESGNLCVGMNSLMRKSWALLSRSGSIDKQKVLETLVLMCKGDETHPALLTASEFNVNGQKNVYIARKHIYDVEMGLAINIAKLARRGFKNNFSIPEEIRLKELEENVSLAPEQRNAVVVGLSNSFSVITGGPGTGKTTILKFIRDIFQKRNKNKNILLCSPTGVAATRMTASTGAEASTVHKALNLLPDDENGGVFGDVPTIDYDLIVVDETSMLDIFLSGALMQSIKDDARVLFIGDIDQLPSVGPGAVLRDIIESGVVPVARLTKVYRQAEENKIAINAILIKNGKSSFEYKKGEFEFIPANNFAEARDKMWDIYLREVAANGVANVMMLSPYRVKTESGVNSLNLIRDKINPHDAKKEELQVGDKLFRVGDRIINLKNNQISANGETGTIISIGYKLFKKPNSKNPDDPGERKKAITVDFGHSMMDYDLQAAKDMLDWSYAMTVHKSQGSEARVVILNLLDGHYKMLKRNLLYTAITRAKVRVYIVGSMTAIEKAVASGVSLDDRRTTLLSQKLRYVMNLSDAGFSELVKIITK